jgi:hypothetical protein
MHARRWAVRLAARLRVEVGVSAALDSAMVNVSPSAPIRRSTSSLDQHRQQMQEKSRGCHRASHRRWGVAAVQNGVQN